MLTAVTNIQCKFTVHCSHIHTTISIFQWIEIHMIYVFRYRLAAAMNREHIDLLVFIFARKYFLNEWIELFSFIEQFSIELDGYASLPTVRQWKEFRLNNGKHGKDVLRVIIGWIEYAVFRVTVRIHNLWLMAFAST